MQVKNCSTATYSKDKLLSNAIIIGGRGDGSVLNSYGGVIEVF